MPFHPAHIVTALVIGVSGAWVVGDAIVSHANEPDRSFSGTVTAAPTVDGNVVKVSVDNVTYTMADVITSFARCGSYEDDYVAKTVENMAKPLLPVGVKVHGYLAGTDHVDSHLAYLHRGPVEGSESISERLVPTAWADENVGGLDLNDEVVADEHEAVLSADTADNAAAARRICDTRNEDEDEDDDRRRHRYRNQPEQHERDWLDEELDQEADESYDDIMRGSDDNDDSSNGNSHKAPNRCYNETGSYTTGNC